MPRETKIGLRKYAMKMGDQVLEARRQDSRKLVNIESNRTLVHCSAARSEMFARLSTFRWLLFPSDLFASTVNAVLLTSANGSLSIFRQDVLMT